MIAQTHKMLINLIFKVGKNRNLSDKSLPATQREAAERGKLLISTFPGCERTLGPYLHLPGDLKGFTKPKHNDNINNISI